MKRYTEIEFDKETYFSKAEGKYEDRLLPGVTLKTNDLELLENIVEFYKTKLSGSVISGDYDSVITSAETIKSIVNCGVSLLQTEDGKNAEV